MYRAGLLKLASIVFSGALPILCAVGLGQVLLRALGLAGTLRDWAERLVFALAIGGACLSAAVFLLCAAQMVYDVSFLVLAAAIGAAYWKWGRPSSGIGIRSSQVSLSKDLLLWIFVAICVAYGALTLANAGAPEYLNDAVAYHLGLVKRYYDFHGFPRITTNFYAFLSQGAEMLFLFAFAFGRHAAAKVAHLAFAVATVAALLTFARRNGIWSAGLIAAVLFVCAPVVALDASSAHIDVALAFYAFMTLYALQVWGWSLSPAALGALGVIAGFCYAIKYTGFVASALTLATVAVWAWRDTRNTRLVARSLAVVCAGILTMVLPWVAKNTIIAGNPVAPFFNRVFPNPYNTVAWEKEYVDSLREFHGFSPERGWQPYLEAPLEITVRGVVLQGMIGPVFLLLPVALLAWRRPLTWVCLGCGLLFAVGWFVNPGVRFLIPALPFLGLAMGIGLRQIPKRAALVVSVAVVLGHAALGWPSIMTKWHPAWVWRIHEVPWRAALGIETQEQYLRRRIDYYAVSQVIDLQTGGRGKVLSLDQLPEAYMRTEVLVCYQGAENRWLFDSLWAPTIHARWPLRILEIPLPEPVLHGFRVLQHDTSDKEEWVVSEIRFKDKEHILVPQEDWRIESERWPWLARNVFDGDLFRMYRTFDPLTDGMTVGVTFPKPLQATAVLVIYPQFLKFDNLSYEIRDAHGDWRAIQPQMTESSDVIEKAEMKRWAARELERNGIDLLLINLAGGGHNFIAKDIAKDAADWGFREVYSEGPKRLYRVEPAPARAGQ